MGEVELLLALLAAAAALATLADRLRLPRPALFVLGGAMLAAVPELPQPRFDPGTLFLLFVPPLLYRGAVQTSFRDFRIELSSIAFLSIAMVLATIAAIAFVTHALVPQLGWPLCYVFGAIVSPTDTVAALAVTRGLPVPRSIVTVLQGEGLVNDATALIAYRGALAVAAGAAFSPLGVVSSFLLDGLGGLLLGLAVGWCVFELRRRLADVPVVQNTASLLTPYVAYICADRIGLSGVLSVVSAGMYLGWQSPRRSAATRLQADIVWDMIVFVLEGLVFILVGLELPIVWAASRVHFEHPLAVEVAAVSATAVGIRLALVFLGLSLIQTLRRLGLLEAGISWRNALVVGWAGMRGGESLAIALALPLSVGLGGNAGQRDLIIVLTFGVILVTLVLQGLTLSGLIRSLDLRDDGNDEKEEAQGRALMARAAIDHLEAVRSVSGIPEGWVSYLREWYEYDAVAGCTPDRRRELEVQLAAFVSLRGELIDAQRQALIRSRNEQTIGDPVMRRLQRELDLQASQLAGLPRQGGSG